MKRTLSTLLLSAGLLSAAVPFVFLSYPFPAATDRQWLTGKMTLLYTQDVIQRVEGSSFFMLSFQAGDRKITDSIQLGASGAAYCVYRKLLFVHRYGAALAADHTIMDVYYPDGSYKGSLRIPVIAETKAKAIHIVKDFAIAIYPHSFAIYYFEPDLFKDPGNKKQPALKPDPYP